MLNLSLALIIFPCQGKIRAVLFSPEGLQGDLVPLLSQSSTAQIITTMENLKRIVKCVQVSAQLLIDCDWIKTTTNEFKMVTASHVKLINKGSHH